MKYLVTHFPKLLLLGCSFLTAYLLFHFGYFDVLEERLNGHGYVSAFLGGLLFSYGFTSPFGIAIMVEIAPHVNPLYAALIGGVGAFLMDLSIFELLRFSAFHDEIRHLRQTRWFVQLHRLIRHSSISERVRTYMLWSFAGIIIASPLPDELGVSIVSSTTDIHPRAFSIICFLCNTAGLLIIVLLAR
jgi:hypothetical protein